MGPAGVAREEAARPGAESGVQGRAWPKRRGPRVQYQEPSRSPSRTANRLLDHTIQPAGVISATMGFDMLAHELAMSLGSPRQYIRRRRKSMAQDFICNPDTGEIVAIIRGGEVFRDDGEGARIATVLGTYIYDLKGNLIGHLQGRSVTDARTRSMPIAFRELLEAKSS